MKKVLSVLLAVLMLCTSFAFAGSAANDPALTLTDVLNIAKEMDEQAAVAGAGEQTKHIVLVFDCKSYKMGTIYEGQEYKINSGRNSGCVALLGERFLEGFDVQLPGLVVDDDESKLDWYVSTQGLSCSGLTFASDNRFHMPNVDNLAEPYIMFTVQKSPLAKQDTLSKIATIFYKVLKVLLGEDIANKLAQLFIELGVEINV